MGATKIEWTDATWNPVVGCTKVSPGCANCYAERMAGRLDAMGIGKYQHIVVKTDDGARWTGGVRIDASAVAEPLFWRKPRRVFVCSMGDLFHESVTFDWVDEVFAIMALCPHHVFQVLTKRPAAMRDYVLSRGRSIEPIADVIRSRDWPQLAGPLAWPLPNVWLGVSAEDQAHADERVPVLLETPAAVRFVSAEPLLGRVDGRKFAGIDWVIIGAETGPGARPCDRAWIGWIVAGCDVREIPCFVKQTGPRKRDKDPATWPPAWRRREWPAR